MKDKRIRLTLKNIQVIAEAIHIYDRLPENAPQDPIQISKLLTVIYGKDRNKLKYSWSDLSNLSRRFHVLAADEGWAARRSR